ncbi:hypothetical protein, partial [Glutamicibacter arilaitensis]|uniref:hypothetical protein n=1 Tax=Glutamicibacter arilaitensis TaxID=256701 RepID=UPI003F92E5EE
YFAVACASASRDGHISWAGECREQACDDYSLSRPRKRFVNWPSAIAAIFVDSLLIWLPAWGALFLDTGNDLVLAIAWVSLVSIVNFASYVKGTSVGSLAAGIRFERNQGQAPGKGYALLLSFLSLFSIPVLAVIILIDYLGNDIPSKPLSKYPLIGIRTAKRRVLEACDKLWG